MQQGQYRMEQDIQRMLFRKSMEFILKSLIHTEIIQLLIVHKNTCCPQRL